MMNPTIALILVLAAAAPNPSTAPAPSKEAAASPAPKSSAAPAPSKKTPISSAPKSTAPASAKAAPAPKADAPAKSTDSKSDSKADKDEGMTMRGGQEGTVFKSLTVEGEDRIRLEFERPTLKVELDPSKAPGLDWGSARDVLDRTRPDFAGPLASATAFEASAGVGHPWLSRFETGAVARFRPDVEGVERWKLSIVDARGVAVASYGGRGEPPREITWDGRSQDGSPVTPGLTYSSVFEAHDKAGNKRNFVGKGFRVSAYRLEGKDGTTLVLSASELPAVSVGHGATASPAPPILIEAASWLNQSPSVNKPIKISVVATSRDQSQALAAQIASWITPNLVGDPGRVQTVATVAADAPEGGTITIATAR